MCTFVYLPLKTRTVLASLRDVEPIRSASQPSLFYENGIELIKPCDSKGGTWIGANKNGYVIVLLNGGFVKHEVQAEYKKSRGLVVNELLASPTPIDQWLKMDLEGIEPFTLFVYQERFLEQLVWDEHKKHQIHLDPEAIHLFSSATLYDEQAALKRKALFLSWYDRPSHKNKNTLLKLFATVNDKENGFIIDRRTGVRTVCLSYIGVTLTNIEFEYLNFLNGAWTIEKLNLNKTMAIK